LISTIKSAIIRLIFTLQLEDWSSKLDLSYNDVHNWFRIKWRARLEHEAAVENQVSI
jgi:hypothetical protein